MNKEEFLSELREELYDLPEGDIEERLTFYSEMIDDRVEEGISEEEALAEIGPADEIASQIRSEVPKPEPAEETASEEFSALPVEASSETVVSEDIPVEEFSALPAEAQPEFVAMEEIPAPEPVAAVPAAPLVQPSAEKASRGRTLRAWEIVLLVLGFPLWGSLLIAAVAVVFSLYVSLWAIILSLWAVFGAMAFSGLLCIGVGIPASIGKGTEGLLVLAAGFIFAGLSVFLYLLCMAVTKGTVFLTVRLTRKLLSL